MKSLIVALLVFTSVALPQELNCTVNVNMDNIPNSTKHLLDDFKQSVSNYMNKTRFSNSDWQNDKINCGLNIFILTATNDGKFSAQVVITSQRPVYQTNKNSLMLSINDVQWSFGYQNGQGLFPDQSTFDPLTGFLDYYAYIIIGFNEDSWNEFGGTPYFNKAISVCNMAITSSYSKNWARNPGQYSKEALVEDLLNDKYRPFREAFYQYYYGIDYYEVNQQKGEEKIAQTIKTIASLKDKIDFASVLLKTFFDAHSGEIIEYLKNYSDKSIFYSLVQIDPSHIAKYNAAMGQN